MTNKRIIALILAALMLAASTSCSSESKEAAKTTAATGQASEESQETSAASEQILPDLPEMNFDGAKMRFLSREVKDTVVRYYSEIASDNMDGEIMNDSVYERTIRIEETYGVDITDQTADDVAKTYKNSYSAGEDKWDVVVDGFSSAVSFASFGYNAEINSLPYIDLEKPWWDTNVAKNMEINGCLYTVIGAMNTWTDSHTYAVIFNKELAADFGFDPYSLVRSGEWTLDQFAAIIKEVTADLDGNGTMDEKDRYGAVGEYFNFNPHMLGCGVTVLVHDDEGGLKYEFGDRFYNAAEKVCAIMTSGDYLLAENYYDKTSDPWTDILRMNFRAGNSLFYVGGIEQLLIFRDLDTEIGVVPMMKFDEDQEDYQHLFSSYWSSAMFVPNITAQKDMAAYMLEAICADSYYSTSVAYYDVVLKGKAVRDTDSCDMIDIIRSTRTVDPEFAYNFLNLNSIYTSALSKKGTDDLASKIEKMKTSATKKLEEFIANYSEEA